MNRQDFERGIFLKQYRISIVKELIRKSIHLCSAFIPSLLDAAYLPTVIALSAAALLYCLSETLRLRGFEVPLVAKITAVAARKRDENKFVLGPVTLVAGILIAAFALTPQGYRIGIYALAFGDGLASFAGKLFGRVRIPLTNGKTAAGSLTCFFAVFVSAFAVCANAEAAFFLALIATFVEVLPLADLDNVVIPVIIGGAAECILRMC
ncbi:MAG: diacylglycerol/polyprenol kinase family protein [Treponema sp.]